MAKNFKLRITRVITTTLQSCRSKDPSTLPEDPVPSFKPVNFPASKYQNRRSSFKGHLSSSFISAGCGWYSKPDATITSDDDCTRSEPQDFKWQHEEKWHVVAKIYEEKKPPLKIYTSSASGGSDEDELTFSAPPARPPQPSTAEKKKRRGKKKKRNVPSRLRISTSSADSGWFSSEGGVSVGDEIDEEETETLVSSSISFSTDSSSEFNSRLHPIQETPFTGKPHRRNRRVAKASKRSGSRSSVAAADGEIPARLSMFKKMIPCSVDGKVKESFAIVKRSKDPYGDFKNSMMEMILEKQMFEEKDLEQLLQCFLSLNSSDYQGIIVQAFSEIWEAIFCSGSKPSSAFRRRV